LDGRRSPPVRELRREEPVEPGADVIDLTPAQLCGRSRERAPDCCPSVLLGPEHAYGDVIKGREKPVEERSEIIVRPRPLLDDLHESPSEKSADSGRLSGL
jgi:hypothetical protein